MPFFENFATMVLQEVDYQAAKAVRHVKRQVLLFVLKTLFLVLSLTVLSAGMILLGSKYVGADIMLLFVGMALFIGFLLLK